MSSKPHMELISYGAAGEVTGSCHLVTSGSRKILLDCGLFQGSPDDEERNRDPFPFDPKSLDAVILSHAHIDHSGRIPLLVKQGYKGPIFTQEASRDLCRIMLKDAGFLNEKDAEWENRKRRRQGNNIVTPLYTMAEGEAAIDQFETLPYNVPKEILPGVRLQFHDAGHILGSAIVELTLQENNTTRSLAYSGDLGHHGAPILRDPEPLKTADLVIMESTYGDRFHRSWSATLQELQEILATANAKKGNIIIPAFAVGRSQELLFLFARYFDEWQLDRWQIFLDSPMAIEATEVYNQYRELYDQEARELWQSNIEQQFRGRLHICRSPEQSMALNNVESGAIILAASGMCTGGRVRHHLKHNVWRENCHVLITGFQGARTLGRALVDGAKSITLWGQTIDVAAQIHTVGGLSAHADQNGLLKWYSHFEQRPPVYLVHGEPRAQTALCSKLRDKSGGAVTIAEQDRPFDLVRRIAPRT